MIKKRLDNKTPEIKEEFSKEYKPESKDQKWTGIKKVNKIYKT